MAVICKRLVRGRAGGKVLRENKPILPVLSVCEREIILEKGEILSEKRHGFLVSPGDWINTYEEHQNAYFAEIDRRIFQMHAYKDQHAIRIGLYLTERWRELAKEGAFDNPIRMTDLLAASIIAIDRKHLTERFIPSIEAALAKLKTEEVIGSYECLTPIERQQTRWSQQWLESSWHILPPSELMSHYSQHRLPSKRRKKSLPSATREA